MSGTSDRLRPPFECPMCGAPLAVAGGAFACASGHSFDIAREGYVNLLLPQHRTRGIEGDTTSMLQARRRFLEAGHYAPLRDALVGAAAAAFGSVAEGDAAVVLEVGCGDGYYLAGIGEGLSATKRNVQLLGMDLSKAAVKAAAKRHPEATFFVGDVNKRIYLRDHFVDVLVDVFAPRNPVEFARVLQRTGCLVIAIPGEAHLASLRSAFGLLDIQGDKEAKVVARFGGLFRLSARTELRYEVALSATDVADLVAMGPNQWHRAALGDGEALRPMVTEASFIVLTLSPNW